MKPATQIKGLKFTRHAHKRLSQRGLSESAVKGVLDFGSRRFLGRGEVICFLGKRDYQRAVRRNPSLKRQLLPLIGITLVVSSTSNSLVTAYRAKRPKRPMR